nr:hypothetical protein [uncultured bacterium]
MSGYPAADSLLRRRLTWTGKPIGPGHVLEVPDLAEQTSLAERLAVRLHQPPQQRELARMQADRATGNECIARQQIDHQITTAARCRLVGQVRNDPRGAGLQFVDVRAGPEHIREAGRSAKRRAATARGRQAEAWPAAAPARPASGGSRPPGSNRATLRA